VLCHGDAGDENNHAEALATPKLYVKAGLAKADFGYGPSTLLRTGGIPRKTTAFKLLCAS